MDKETQQSIENAKCIIEAVMNISASTAKVMDLSNLQGLTSCQKKRIDTSLNLISIVRAELLKATYPNDDIFGQPRIQ